ncbi:disease resistance protein Roq1-like [Syzygium oleosum]|uniref:disease resistance protein Roq1-like n=1 Tax=Syzygium oleosum TaxID=219896 RepID=UPI0024BA774F|nr:disease resistance protein Roq1-like [Syzygium oleosum]
MNKLPKNTVSDLKLIVIADCRTPSSNGFFIKRIYDVFLSFRGADLRNNFLSHLYKALDQNGIYTFVDSEEMRKGDEISPTLMKAIEQSCIAIIVFSEDYAYSRWCLEEVAKIMECKEQKDLTVLPVFYKVDPREVRRGRESYGRALAKHESKFGKDSEEVKRWKKALFNVGSLSGWHLNDGDESKLIQKIVKEISNHLDRKPLHVAKHPVGIDSQVIKLKSTLNLESDDGILMAGLWGQGGIGKTSLGDCAGKAIELELPEPTDMYIGPDAFTKMRRLRLLIMHNVHNAFQGPLCLSHELRWFEWPGCAPSVPEFSSGRNKLVGFDVSKSSITVVLKQFTDFPNMKYMNLSECEMLISMPDLSCAPNLEELNLENCKNLVEAHESIAYHDNLQVLTLKGCSELSVFPNELKSRNLRALHLANCTKLGRFPDIPQKLGLKELALQGTAIRELPTSIENLVSLERMNVGDCKNLVSLPSSIYKLQNIEKLILEGCTKLFEFPKYEDLADPHMKTGLPKLLYLNLRGCNLSEVKFLENLSCFPLLDCLVLAENKITSLPTSINKRDSLTFLEVQDCHQLQEILELPPFLDFLGAVNCESLQKIGKFTSSHDFVRRVFTMDHIFSRNQVRFSLSLSLSHALIHVEYVRAVVCACILQNQKTQDLRLKKRAATNSGGFFASLPGGDMPKWVIPVKEDFISFMASKDLYDKFLGFALCAIVKTDNETKQHSAKITLSVNGKRRLTIENIFGLLDSDHIWFSYIPSKPWGVVDFDQIEGSYAQFHLAISGKIIKKLGFRIICKQLDDDLEGVLQDNQLIDSAFLYEVSHDSTDSEAESSLVHTETDLQKDSEDCQISTKKYSQIAPKRNHNPILAQGIRTKTVLTSNSIGGDEYGGVVGLQLLL